MQLRPKVHPSEEPIDSVNKVMNWFIQGPDLANQRAGENIEPEAEQQTLSPGEILELMRRARIHHHPSADSDIEDLDEGNLEFEDDKEIQEYRNLIQHSRAYSWLVSKLRANMLLSQGSAHDQCYIQQEVLDFFPAPRKVSRRVLPEVIRAEFVLVGWDPLVFLQTQHNGAPSAVCEKVIVLTGSSKEVQATTVRQFLDQTWPCLAETISQLLCGTLRAEYAHAHQGTHKQC